MPGAAPRMTRATLAPMTGKIEAYDHLLETARAIREQVFIRERDWRPEFDEWDAVAVHLLAFDGNRTVATCRFYADPDHSDQPGRYVIARLAVLPDAQGRGSAPNCWPTPNAVLRTVEEPSPRYIRRTTTTSSTSGVDINSPTNSTTTAATVG